EYVLTSEDALLDGMYESGIWYPTTIATAVAMLYNTDLVSEEQAAALDSYEGLWGPEIGDLPIGLPNVATGQNAQQFFYFLDETYGRESWTSLHSMNQRVYNSSPAGDAVARGEIAVTPASEAVALRAYLDGAPVRWRIPTPTLGTPYPQVIA